MTGKSIARPWEEPQEPSLRRPILVIDDDPQTRELVTAMLNSGGLITVLLAPDGPAGIELARAARPAIILLDMMMPGLDGLSTCQRLKQDPIVASIPVVGITASPDLRYAQQAFRAGTDLFLPKPFTRATLLHSIALTIHTAPSSPATGPQRLYPRFPADLPVRCRIRGDARSSHELAGHTLNVSLGGLLLFLPEGIVPGTGISLELGLPDGPLSLEGTVVWQRPRPSGQGRVPHGVELAGFGEEATFAPYRRHLSQIACAGEGI
ncbi:MAG: response regulator [Candidatus Methylomirabilales bacterium]